MDSDDLNELSIRALSKAAREISGILVDLANDLDLAVDDEVAISEPVPADVPESAHTKRADVGNTAAFGQSKTQYSVGLTDLIEAGVLERRQELFAPYKGETHRAFIEKDGSVTVVGHGTAPTLSWAARFFTPSTANGWVFWHIRRSDSSLVTLAEVREQFMGEA